MSAPAIPGPRRSVEQLDPAAVVELPAPRPPVRRGTSNGNARGSTRDRARRRAWLLAEFGDGQTCRCYRCSTVLDAETITVDRIVPGVEGGTYRRSNIRPACGTCNSETGGLLAGARARARLDQGRHG